MLFSGSAGRQQRLLASRRPLPAAVQSALPRQSSRSRRVGYIKSSIAISLSTRTARQTLFDESDALNVLPKAVAAERKLRSINSSVAVEGVVADLSPRNAEALLVESICSSMARQFRNSFLINDVAVKSSRPWIYAAVSPLRPDHDHSSCRDGLSCLSSRIWYCAQGLEETCDTIGVLGPIVNLIASLEVAEP